MTKSQTAHLLFDRRDKRTGKVIFSLWSQACAAMGWNRDDRRLRLEVFGRAIGRPITTSSEIGKLDDFTRLKGYLLAIIRPDDLDSQLRQVEMPRTNLVFGIQKNFPPQIVKRLLAQRFAFAVWLRRRYPEHAGKTISPDSLHGPAPASVVEEYRLSGARPPALEDLNFEELVELRNTLARICR